MNVRKYALILGLTIICGFSAPKSASAVYFSDFVYQNVKIGNMSEIVKYLQSGRRIDEVNAQKLTALCQAVKNNDYESYRKLRRLGANPEHKCMELVSRRTSSEFAQRYRPSADYVEAVEDDSNLTKYAVVGGVIAAGAVAWAVFDDDSGHSSSDSNSDNNDNQNEEEPKECPENTHKVGNLCVADGEIIENNDTDKDVFGIYSDAKQVFNLYSSPKYPDDVASISINNTGNGTVYGMYGYGGEAEVFNSYVAGTDDEGVPNPVDTGVGNIKITNSGKGNVYGLYSQITDITQYKEAINVYGINYGTAYGNIDIMNMGGGASYGVFGDVRAYNVFVANGGKGYGDITIRGNGDIYGVSGYVAGTNVVDYNGWGKLIGHINLYSEGDGNVYGIMVKKDTIPGAGAGDGGYASWFAFNTYATGGEAEGKINIRNQGNGNAYGMYGGQQLFNAMSYGYTGYSKGTINIANFGNGDVYGMYMPEADKDGLIANISDGRAQSVISLVNTGAGMTTGVRGGEDTSIHNSGTVLINNLGSGDAVGVYGEARSKVYNGGKIEIMRQKYIDAETGNVFDVASQPSGNIYGVYGETGSQVFNALAEGGESMSGRIHLVQSGNADVYGVYSKGNIYNAVARSSWLIDTTEVDDPSGEGTITERTGKSLTSQAIENIDIVNYGNNNAYGIYGTGNIISAGQDQEYDAELGFADVGKVSSVITIENHGLGNAYGIYSTGGSVAHLDGDNAQSVINVANVGNGTIYGIYGEDGAHIINSGTINLNNLNNGSAIGVFGGKNSIIENDGKIIISREAFRGDDGTLYEPVSENGGTAYGIYAQNDSKVLNTGDIIVKNAQNGQGIYLEEGAVLENSGKVEFNGEQQNLEDTSTEASINLDSFGGEIVLADKGQFIAGSLSGNLGVSQRVVLGSFGDKYVLDNSLKAEDISSLQLNSKSAMFQSATQKNEKGGYDVVLTRQSFTESLDNKSLGEFLDTNYEQQNNIALYDALKTAPDENALLKSADNIAGADVLPDFRKENALVYQHLSRQFNDNLFNHPEDNYIGGYKYIDASVDGYGTLSESDATAQAAYGMLKGKSDNGVVYGLGATMARLKSDYDNGSQRKSNIFGVWAPVGYNFHNGTRWFSKLYAGYADGSYDRVTMLGKYSADISEYQYGISNEVRHQISLGHGFVFEPTGELNLLGVYQDGFSEGKTNSALSVDSNNSLSLEGGLGAYLAKEFSFNENNKLSVQIGGIYYVEFLDPDDGYDATMAEMSRRYKIKNKSQDDRAVLSLRLNYNYKDLMLYSTLEKETGTGKAFSVDAGVQYNF